MWTTLFNHPTPVLEKHTATGAVESVLSTRASPSRVASDPFLANITLAGFEPLCYVIVDRASRLDHPFLAAWFSCNSRYSVMAQLINLTHVSSGT